MIYERIEKMEKELAELKVLAKKEEEFKVGDYLILIDNYKMSALNGAIAKCHGNTEECVDVRWLCEKAKTQNNGEYLPNTFRKATPSEIETFLKKEAEKKGFVKGARVNRGKIDAIYFYPTIPKGKLSDSIRKFEKENGVNFLVLEIGCSTIPLEECDLPSCPQITIGNNKVEFNSDHIKVGCTRVELSTIQEIAEHYENK